MRWHFHTDLMLVTATEMYSNTVINSVLEEKTKIMPHNLSSQQRQNEAQCCRVSVNKLISCQGDCHETQVAGGAGAADARSQTSAWPGHSITLPAEWGKRLRSSLCISLLSLHQACEASWVFSCCWFFASRGSLWEEKSLQQLFAPVRNRICYSWVAGGIWQSRVRYWELSTVPEIRGRVPQTGAERINSFFCLDTNTSDLRDLCSDFVIPSAIAISISGYICSNAAKSAIWSGTGRTWPCQALHVPDRKAQNKIFQLASVLLNLNDFSTCISRPLQCKIRKDLEEHKERKKTGWETVELPLLAREPAKVLGLRYLAVLKRHIQGSKSQPIYLGCCCKVQEVTQV